MSLKKIGPKDSLLLCHLHCMMEQLKNSQTKFVICQTVGPVTLLNLTFDSQNRS